MKISTPHGTLEGDNIETILKQYGLDCLRGACLHGACLYGADLSYASLHGADLSYANLRSANLSRTDLHGANLYHANLSRTDLHHANLSYANLHDANLSHADLSYASLRSADVSRTNLCAADLCGVNLSRSDLSRASLYGANLYSADLSRADLSGANLSHANHVKLSIAEISILPDEGDIIGWKKAYIYDTMQVIVKLLIPADAQRSNGTGRKCRASKARILDLQDKQGNSLPPDTTARSAHDQNFTYKKGETIHVENFDTNRWNECAPGIHFFITRIEAVEY